MNILEEIAQEYLNDPNHGIKFSVKDIDQDIFTHKLGDRISFGESVDERQMDTLYEYKDIILDGKPFGYIQFSITKNYLHPTIVSFCYVLADCTEPEALTAEMVDSPHFDDLTESYRYKFATLQQMLDYLHVH